MANIFKEDQNLVQRINELDDVNSKAEFSQWKTSFVKIVQSLLDQDGTRKAELAYEEFNKNLVALDKTGLKLQACVDNGSLSSEKCSVKARRSLAELQAALAKISANLASLLPGNQSAKAGYTNYHMGASLINEGFTSYTTLVDAETALVKMREETLQFVADKQLLEEIENYRDKLKMFCAIMADLGIFVIAKKADHIIKTCTDEPDVDHFTNEQDSSAVKNTPAEIETAPPTVSPEAAPTERSPVTAKDESENVSVEMQVSAPAENKPIPAKAATVPAPKQAPTVAAKPKPQTINITATHEEPKIGPVKKVRKAPRKPRGVDGPNDLPRTMKPKKPVRLPGGDDGPRGRGVGRALSKEEAREAPRRGSQRPNRPSQASDKGKLPDEKDKADEEEPPEEDDNEDDNNKEDNEKAEELPSTNTKPGGASKRAAGTTLSSKQSTSPAVAGQAVPAKNGTPRKPASTKVPIIVHYRKKQFKFLIDPAKTRLGPLRTLLEKTTKLPVDNQLISMRFSGTQFDLDDKVLSFYGCKEDSELDLDPKWIKIIIKMPGGESHTFDKISVTQYTINSLKGKIERETGLEKKKQLLRFNSQELLNGTKIMKQVGIQDGATIHVEEEARVNIQVLFEGKEIVLFVDCSKETLGDVRKKLEERTPVKTDNQRIFLKDGEELEAKENCKKSSSSSPLKNFGIQEGSELVMERRYINVTVQTLDGSKHKLKVTMESNMSDMIKKMVEVETGKQDSSAVLKFGGKEFRMNQTARDLGLKEGSLVKLEKN